MRIALGIEYNGSRFFGWQIQLQDRRTVQQELEHALTKIANEPIRVTCAGRTDTGVHATQQVVHFDTRAVRHDSAWVLGVNAHLPPDVACLWSRPVADDFSARFSATARQYRYIILNRQARPALLEQRLSWRHGPIDHVAMHEAAQSLIGEHDFSAFRSSICQAAHARRTLYSVQISRHQDYIYVDITANAFLHHMVRNIVGSLLMVGTAEKPGAWIGQLLAGRDRSKAGPTAPAHGLYLIKVTYPDHFGLPQHILYPSL
jgi:tRNA pseudouridine38-40 synthase